MRHHDGECPSDGTDYHGRCLGECGECGEHLLSTGRYTAYCPGCDTCSECGCPACDGFEHYAECSRACPVASYYYDRARGEWQCATCDRCSDDCECFVPVKE
jgi:hypothetical protein